MDGVDIGATAAYRGQFSSPLITWFLGLEDDGPPQQGTPTVLVYTRKTFLSTTEFKFRRTIVLQAWVSSVVLCRVSNLKDGIFVHDGI